MNKRCCLSGQQPYPFYFHPVCSFKTGGFSKSAYITRDPKHKLRSLNLSDLKSCKGCKAS